ncbi:MAG: hypothetical protein ACRD6W_18645, partial [Nitrososphaerales archaeon]
MLKGVAVSQLACDYLYAPAMPSAIAAAGYVAVLSYLRSLTVEDITALLAAGLGVGLIFETLADEATLGAARGTA